MICPVCSNNTFTQQNVLKERLIKEWELSLEEVDYINRQQGLKCEKCLCNLRSMNIAYAILRKYKLKGNLQINSLLFFKRKLKILEINRAGDLHFIFERFNKYTFAEYPDFDMQKLPFKDNSFDLIVHSDTLEHVENSDLALAETYRILKEDGVLIYTIPIIYSRLTRNRKGLVDSYHGSQEESQGNDYKVWKEYGSDFWIELLKVGFNEITITTIDGLNSIAITAIKKTKSEYGPDAFIYRLYIFSTRLLKKIKILK